MVIGIASLIIAFLMPLSVDPSRSVWIAGFGAAAVWFGLMAIPRYRSSTGRTSWVARIGLAAGVATICVAAYAFIVAVSASGGTRLPAPPAWVDTAVPPTAQSLLAPEPARTEGSPSPSETERLALAQSVGTAVYVLEQTAASDGTWPASLAVSTDASALATLDGIQLAPLPPGTQVVYSTSSDQREFSLTLIGPLGAAAAYDSTTRTIASSIP